MPQRIGSAMLLAALAGCGRPAAPPAPPPLEILEAALRPSAAVGALRRSGGAHWKGSALIRVSAASKPRPPEAPAAPDAVTTTTEVWLDKRGHYRIVESNDLDGGREVVRHGRDLAVALKYGKPVKRPAQEPEPTRLLEEAIGAPWAAWEVVGRFATVERTAPGAYRLSRADEGRVGDAAAGPLGKWRDSVAVQSIEGEARLDERTGALLSFALKARYTATRDGEPLTGELAVATRTDGLGSTPDVAPPDAEELRVRQRTIVEERALLGKKEPR